MGFFRHASLVSKKLKQDSLRINLRKGEVRMSLRVFAFRDKDTRQLIYYIPGLNVTGYGADEKKAIEMVNFCIDEIFTSLTKLSQDELNAEMKKLGFIQAPYTKKEFSKAYVDGDGNLHQFNAVANKVEQLALVA